MYGQILLDLRGLEWWQSIMQARGGFLAGTPHTLNKMSCVTATLWNQLPPLQDVVSLLQIHIVSTGLPSFSHAQHMDLHCPASSRNSIPSSNQFTQFPSNKSTFGLMWMKENYDCHIGVPVSVSCSTNCHLLSVLLMRGNEATNIQFKYVARFIEERYWCKSKAFKCRHQAINSQCVYVYCVYARAVCHFVFE